MQGRRGHMYGHYATVLCTQVKFAAYRFPPLAPNHKADSKDRFVPKMTRGSHGLRRLRYQASAQIHGAATRLSHESDGLRRAEGIRFQRMTRNVSQCPSSLRTVTSFCPDL
jgi:hypothetical protein